MWILLALNLFFFVSSHYIISGNDGSHFALVSALVEKRSVIIDPYVSYTGHVDYCTKGGHDYSDRPPGTALLAIPFYSLGKVAQYFGWDRQWSRDPNICEVFVLLLPNLAGTLVVLLMFRLLRHFGCGVNQAMITALICALGTPIWFEATRLYSHIISMLAVLWAAYLVITTEQGPRAFRRLIWCAFLLGYASIVEIQNILFVVPFGLYAVCCGKLSKREAVKTIAVAVAVFCAVYAILLIYNYAAFGELTIKSNKYNPGFPEESSFGAALSGNFLLGFDRLFTGFGNLRAVFHWHHGVRNNSPALLIQSPILFLSAWGYWKFFRTHRAEAIFFLSLIVLDTAVASCHKTVLTRHISTILPFLALPCYFAVNAAYERMRKSGSRLSRFWPAALIASLFGLSVAHGYYVMNTHWGRSLKEPWRFMNELPSYGAVAGACLAVYLICLAAKWIATRLSKEPVRIPGTPAA